MSAVIGWILQNTLRPKMKKIKSLMRMKFLMSGLILLKLNCLGFTDLYLKKERLEIKALEV